MNNEFPEIATPFSVVVRQTDGRADLVVERAMYWNDFEGGHGSTAVTAPSTTWLFAEGNTGGERVFDFQTYLLLANPGTADANVTLDVLPRQRRPRGLRSPAPPLCGPTARVTLCLDDLNIGTACRSCRAHLRHPRRGEQPILAERAMYWSSNGIVFIEGHNTPGVNAEGAQVGVRGGPGRPLRRVRRASHDSFFLFSNSSAYAAPHQGHVRARRRHGHGPDIHVIPRVALYAPHEPVPRAEQPALLGVLRGRD